MAKEAVKAKEYHWRHTDWRATHHRCEIWCAKDPWDEDTVGILVTAPGDIDRPLFFVRVTEEFDEEFAYNVASSIVDDPANVFRPGRWANEPARVIDFARYYLPDNAEEWPGFVYGLLCRPAADGGDVDDDALDNWPVSPAPVCPVRLKLWQQQAKGRRRTA
jgi:hypothetical protein